MRCGRCANVFDGFKMLTTLPDDAPADAAVEPASPGEPGRGEATALAKTSRAYAAAREVPRRAAQPEPAMYSSAAISHYDIDAAEPNEPVLHRSSRGWGFGILVLLVVLAGQGAYFYRSEIAANLPDARPHLRNMCELLRCTVALPQRPRQISIEASDMQATDSANPGLIVLTATLRNQAGIEIGYPALDVVLTNSKEQTVARRIFLPSDYLDAGRDARGGIAPNVEVVVRLNLDTGDLGAAGFRLDLLAAPAR